MTQLTVTPSNRKFQQHSVSLFFGLFLLVGMFSPYNLPLPKPHYLIQDLLALSSWNYMIAKYHLMLITV